MSVQKLFSVLIAIAFAAQSSFGTIELPDIIGDNMVLQQNTDARLWGWATPGSKITVTSSWSPKAKHVGVTDSDGRWEVKIPTPDASFSSRFIRIKGDGSDITIDNVLIGRCGSALVSQTWRCLLRDIICNLWTRHPRQ